MFVDLDWPTNASSLLSASAELLVLWAIVKVQPGRHIRALEQGSQQHFLANTWLQVVTGTSTVYNFMQIIGYGSADILQVIGTGYTFVRIKIHELHTELKVTETETEIIFFKSKTEIDTEVHEQKQNWN